MCPTEIELIRLLSGEMPDPQRQRLSLHLQACADCARALQELTELWDVLGADELDHPPRDLIPQVLASVSEQSRAWRWSRVAAAVVLSAGVGVATGFLIPTTEPAALAAPPVSAVVTGTGLDMLAQPPAGVAQLFVLGPEEQL